MEQHPIPQQISSYEFRLVGDMTLKQFAQVAGGCIISLIFYASPLPWFLKWPAILLFISLGVGLAFFPVEERPLQTWIVAFLRAIYSPTQYIWQKKAKTPEIFVAEEPKLWRRSEEKAAIPGDQKKLAEYLASLPTAQNPLDEKETAILAQIQQLFSGVTANQPTMTTTIPAPSSASMPTPTPITRVAPPTLPQYTPPPPTTTPWSQARLARPSRFAPTVALPSIPESANILVGIVKNTQGRIVEGAILEIRDSLGNPVRALRTNKLGQFRTATPLPNGIYEIETEKEGVVFEIMKVELKGEIVQPIEIKAKND